MAGLRQALALTAREEFERVPPIFPLHRLPWELQRRILSYADPRGLLAWACEAARDTFGVSWALGVMYAWDEHKYMALASAAEKERVQDTLAVDEAELEEHLASCDNYWLAAKESDAAMQFQRLEGPDAHVCECIVDSWRAFASCLLSIPLGHEQEPFDMEAGASLYYRETENVLELLWKDRFCKVLYPMAADDVFLRSSVLRHRTVSLIEYLGIVTLCGRLVENTMDFCKRNEACTVKDASTTCYWKKRAKAKVQRMHDRGVYDALCTMYLRDVGFTGRAARLYGAP